MDLSNENSISASYSGSFYSAELTGKHFHIGFKTPVSILSSAVYGGGFQNADHIFNLKVGDNFDGGIKEFESPEATLARYSSDMGWTGNVVGMMTSAPMFSFRTEELECDGVSVVAFLTAGVANAKRAGESAEWRKFEDLPSIKGTINVMAVTNAELSAAAMAESIITITEAKSAVLHELGVRSPYSGQLATGTGTDSVAVVSGKGPVKVKFCGKHVLFGEMLAKVVHESLMSSLLKK